MKSINDRIEKAVDKEILKTGKMGTEKVSVEIELTDKEKEIVRNADIAEYKAFGKNYWWELKGNKMLANWSEE